MGEPARVLRDEGFVWVYESTCACELPTGLTGPLISRIWLPVCLYLSSGGIVSFCSTYRSNQ